MSEVVSVPVVPPTDRYTWAFRSLDKLPTSYRDMLQFQYSAPNRTVTATQMAHAAGFQHHGVANLHYGKLGRLVGNLLDFHPTKMPVDVLVTQSNPDKEWLWTMRPEVGWALEQLGWVFVDSFSLPEEVAETTPLFEGVVCRVSVNAYERNPQARHKCIAHWGTSCFVCGFNFGEVFGELGEGFIHVHHLRPLSEIAEEYEVDPVKDLCPVCPNCHAMIHRRSPPLSVEEVKVLLEQNC